MKRQNVFDWIELRSVLCMHCPINTYTQTNTIKRHRMKNEYAHITRCNLHIRMILCVWLKLNSLPLFVSANNFRTVNHLKFICWKYKWFEKHYKPINQPTSGSPFEIVSFFHSSFGSVNCEVFSFSVIHSCIRIHVHWKRGRERERVCVCVPLEGIG